MFVAQKSRYAIRALFELARRHGQGPVKIVDIAEAQAIPPRFLEAILRQLKQGGFVDSKRGADGGYFLVRSPLRLSVGEVLRFLEGPIDAAGCFPKNNGEDCPLYGDCVFLPMWQKAANSLSGVYDSTFFQFFVDEDRRRKEEYVPFYTI